MPTRSRAPRGFRTVKLSREIPDRDHFGDLLNSRGLVGEAVEVGTHRGIWAEQLLTRWTGRTLHLVDPWQFKLPGSVDDISVMENREAHYHEAMARLDRFSGRWTVHRRTSAEAVTGFDDSSLDFVYIDGNHAYEFVRDDVASWWPKVKPGGILAGHDWGGEWKRNVRRAVLEHACPLGLRVWLVDDRDGYRSWWIERP